MEPETISLKPNSDLLDPNFEGYKLKLDKIAIHSKDIEQGVLQAPEAEDSYSYQQVRLYALHNHLWPDLWHPDVNYYFSANGHLQLIGLDQSPAPAAPLWSATVLRLPAGGGSGGDGGPRQAAHPSLSLASERLALVSDGRGLLHLVNTGERDKAQPWEVVLSESPLDGAGFVLVHSTLDARGALHVLTEHVTEADSVPEWRPLGSQDGKEAAFVNLFTWVTFVQGEGGWRMERLRQAGTSGTVHYACLDTPGRALCVASERPVHFIRDSEKPVQPPKEKPPQPAKPSAPLYVWTQTADDVTVQLNSGGGGGGDVRVVLEAHMMTVSVGGEPLLRGALAAGIRLDESTWTNDDGRIEVVLAKVERGGMWADLIPGDTRGEQAVDPELAAQISESLAHLTSEKQNPDPDKPRGLTGTETEECDDFPEPGSALVRIDGDTHTATHEASLSSHQYMLTVRLTPSEQPAFCIRHDVDALIWQPRSQEDRWQCDHVGTLHAFGFVQASKQQRKFMTCATDMSYAAICDTSRHVYIYHQPSPVSGDLRNRKTGRRVTEVSRQQVISLEDSDAILGMTATPGCLYVLTTGRLHALVLR